jgi:hypothetical protein
VGSEASLAFYMTFLVAGLGINAEMAFCSRSSCKAGGLALVSGFSAMKGRPSARFHKYSRAPSISSTFPFLPAIRVDFFEACDIVQLAQGLPRLIPGQMLHPVWFTTELLLGTRGAFDSGDAFG